MHQAFSDATSVGTLRAIRPNVDISVEVVTIAKYDKADLVLLVEQSVLYRKDVELNSDVADTLKRLNREHLQRVTSDAHATRRIVELDHQLVAEAKAILASSSAGSPS